MGEYRLWDSDREESIPAEDVLEIDNMLYDVALPRGLLTMGDEPGLVERAQRLLLADFGIIEFRDGSTMLVELLNGPDTLAALRAGDAPPPLRCLIIG